MRFLILLCLVGMAMADPFFIFSKAHNKRYKSMEEFLARKETFLANYQKMEEHNAKFAAGEVTWAMKVFEDMDLTAEEWMAKRASGLPKLDKDTVTTDSLDERIMKKIAAAKKNKMMQPRDFNWVDQGVVSSVKNQAQCGSCAAFAAMGAIESCYYLKSGVMVDDMSEQHILDCAYNHVYNDADGSWGAFGCDGAWPQTYLDWLEINGEYNQMESSYPYTSGSSGDVTRCSPSSGGYNSNNMVTGMQNQWFTDENDMEYLLMEQPVITAVQATNNWGGYSHGVLDDYLCCDAASDSSCVYNLNHAVLVVGYGHDSASGLDYWLIKNSWSTSWGESGYFKLKRGTGHCGVGSLHQTIPTCM